MGGRKVLTGLAAVAFFAAAAPCAHAWDRPLELTHRSAGIVPRVAIDRHGVTRAIAESKPGRYEVLSLRAGSRRVRHCRVPGSYPEIKLFEAGLSWAANAAGAMVFAFTNGFEHQRVLVTSAAAGRCFRKPRAMSAPKRTSKHPAVAIGPLGTALAVWGEVGAHGRERSIWTAGRAGGRLRSPRVLAAPPRVRGSVVNGAAPDFFSSDRVVWSQNVGQRLAGDPGGFRYRRMAAVSGPRAGAIGRYREVAQTERYEDTLADELTNLRGGQVMGVFDGFGHLLLRRRAVGRAYGPPRSVAITDPYEGSVTTSAGNDAGDTAFAWTRESTVYVLIRRRNGQVVGPQAIAVANGLGHADEPVVGLDGAGRAMVAWVAKDAERSQSAPGEVQVTTPVRGRLLGPAVRVSGARRAIFDDVSVAVNARGRAAVEYRREVEAPEGVVGVHDYVVRGRLGR
jgi:hypothetical protein